MARSRVSTRGREAIVTSATGDQLLQRKGSESSISESSRCPCPEPSRPGDISRLVEALFPRCSESVVRAEISQIVQAQVEQAAGGQLTRGDVESLVAAAVEGAVGDQLSADDVKAIVDSSLMATNAAIEDAAMKADEARMTAEQAVEAAESAYRGPTSITIAVGALPANLVANVIPSLQSRITSRLIYGQLAALNDVTGAIEPELAESYGFLPGSTDTIELKLKQGVTFHNGETLDAHGLLKSFELLMAETAEVAWAFRGLDRYVDRTTELARSMKP